MATDYSFLGSGNVLIREYGASAPFVEVGNCSALTLSPQEDVKQLTDSTTPGGGLRNEVRRVTGVDISYTPTDFSPENFARGARGTSSAIASGTTIDEQVVAYKGGYTPLAKIANSITAVRPAGGTTPYVAGTDYEFRDGQIYIPSTSSIPDPVAGAANIEVDYAHPAQKKVEAMVNSNKQYEVLFMGLNEARSGKKVRVRCHKVSGGVVQQFAFIGDDFGTMEIGGGLLIDTTKTGVGVSKYFTVEMED